MGEETRKKRLAQKVQDDLNELMKNKTAEEQAVLKAHASNQMGQPMRPAGMKLIGFIQDRFDACTDKIVADFGRILTNKGYAPLLVLTKDFKDVLDYVCSHVVMFRTGYYPESDKYIKGLGDFRHYIRKYGIDSTYYADDHIWPFTNGAPVFLANSCDRIIVSSEYIRNVIRSEFGITKPTYVLPTHLDITRFDTDCPAVNWQEKKFRILYSSQGGIGIHIVAGLMELMNEDPEEYKDVEIIMACQNVAMFRALVNKYRHVNKRYYDWLSLNTFFSLVKSVDLLIAPGEPEDCVNPKFDYHQKMHWLNSKSEVKYCLAGAANIPIIASPTEPYINSVNDSETGILAVNTPDFLKWINIFRYDEDLRVKIGNAARVDVEKKYNSIDRALQFLEIITDKSIYKPTAVKRDVKRVYIPKTEGGPQSFERNMTKWLPIVSRGKWEVSNDLKDIDAMFSIAFINAPDIEIYKTDHPKVKQIFRVDGLPLHFSGEIYEEQLRSMLNIFKAADKIVWQSEHCKKFWKKWGVDTETGVVIPNGVDLEIYRAEGSKMSGFPDDKQFKVLHLNWSTFPHKRFDYLKLFAHWAKDLSDRFSIGVYAVGNYASVQQIENVQFLSDAPIKYLGNIMDKEVEGQKLTAAMLRSVDALLFTSEMEGSPHTLLEGIACKKIIMANPNSDIVDEICGDLHYKVGSVNELEETMLKLQDPSVVSEKQMSARKLALKFSTQKMVERYCEVLESWNL